jgi:exopolysaccharide biosynthesis polyprenyl glycosylphosphotransferase
MRAEVAMTDVPVAAPERAWSDADSRRQRQFRLLPAVFVGLAVLIDGLLIIDALAIAYVLQVGPGTGAQTAGVSGSPFWLAVIVGGLAIALLASRGLYDLDHPLPWPSQLYAVVSSVSIALVGAVGVTAFLDAPVARAWSAAGSAIAIAALGVWHIAAARGYAALSRTIVPGPRAIVVGANVAGRESARELEQKGYQVVGYADNGSDLLDEVDRPLLGPIARLDELVQDFGVDELVIALPTDRRAQLSRVLTRGFGRRVRVKYAADFGDLLPRRFNVRWIGARHYIDFAPVAPVSCAKRIFDVALAGLGLVALAPVLVAIAIAIKLDSPGPAFYGQLRVGKDGRPFRMRKFRSMRQDADGLMAGLLEKNEVTGPMFKIRRDPRITRVGRFLRRYSLDELPQLFNVVLGDMSLVGPRPPTATEVAKYEDWEVGRLRAVPGITGLWQVSGRSEVPFHDMVRLDLHYIRNWSFGLDVEILLRTIPAVLTTKGAY